MFNIWKLINNIEVLDLFRLRGCEKINEKYPFRSIVFFHDLSRNQFHFLKKWEMGNEKIMSIWSYLFLMYLTLKCINIPLGSISKVVIILLIKSEIGLGILA